MNGLLVKINRFLVFMKPVYFAFLLSSLFIFAASTEIFASDKNTKACVDCPEMVPIPGNKFADRKILGNIQGVGCLCGGRRLWRISAA